MVGLTAEQFGVEPGQIRPDDNFLQSNPANPNCYVDEIAEEFGISDKVLLDKDFDGAIDNVWR